MTNQDLAKFYNISAQAVGRWSVEKRKQKTVQALANAEQTIVDLIADINKLAYIYDCKHLCGIDQTRWCHVDRTAWKLTVMVHYSGVSGPRRQHIASMHATDVVEQLQSIKTKLEELVYGVSTID